MTDRYHSLTVCLEHDIRSDDAEPLIEAIKHIKGVLTVEGNVSGIEDWVAESRVRHDLHKKLFAVIYPRDN